MFIKRNSGILTPSHIEFTAITNKQYRKQHKITKLTNIFNLKIDIYLTQRKRIERIIHFVLYTFHLYSRGTCYSDQNLKTTKNPSTKKYVLSIINLFFVGHIKYATVLNSNSRDSIQRVHGNSPKVKSVNGGYPCVNMTSHYFSRSIVVTASSSNFI